MPAMDWEAVSDLAAAAADARADVTAVATADVLLADVLPADALLADAAADVPTAALLAQGSEDGSAEHLPAVATMATVAAERVAASMETAAAGSVADLRMVVLPMADSEMAPEPVATLHLSADNSDVVAAVAAKAVSCAPIAGAGWVEQVCLVALADFSAAETRTAPFLIRLPLTHTPVAARWAARAPVAFRLTSTPTTRIAAHAIS